MTVTNELTYECDNLMQIILFFNRSFRNGFTVPTFCVLWTIIRTVTGYLYCYPTKLPYPHSHLKKLSLLSFGGTIPFYSLLTSKQLTGVLRSP